MYVKNLTKSDATIDTATAGHFTAAASLTANFSGMSVAEDDYNSITGTINKFELSGGEENAWSVSLKGLIVTPTTVSRLVLPMVVERRVRSTPPSMVPRLRTIMTWTAPRWTRRT